MNRLARLARSTALTLLAGAAGCAHSAAPRWSYSGENGPEHWAALESSGTCGSGKQQSPIDLAPAQPATLPALELQYRPAKAVVRNTGHTIQLDLDGGGSITIGEHVYNLKRLQFHAPAEHAVGGERPPLEVDLVHTDSTGALAMVGVFFRTGADNGALAAILADPPREEGASRKLPTTFDPSALLPAEHGQYRYDGSLTAPPCTEGVTWTVMKSPLELSDSQLAAFRALYDGNARPLQPLGDRAVSSDAAN